MVQVDLLVESDEMPRVRLLQDHMRKLDVDLVLHEAEPDKPTPRRVIVPKAIGSAFAELRKKPGVEYIALHLDERSHNIPANFSVRIPSWPGRSSDHDVRQLANYLHQPVEKPAGKPAGKRRPIGRSNAAVMAAFALLSAALIGLASMESEKSAPNQGPLDESLPTQDTTHANHDIRPGIPTGIAVPDTIATARSNVRPPRACADPLEVLQATLTWQDATDFAPCQKKQN